MNEFIPELRRNNEGKAYYCCRECGRRCQKPKSNIIGRPKETTPKYAIDVKVGALTLTYKFPSLTQAAEELRKKGHTQITRHNLMYCLKGKFKYPNMTVQLIKT